ncbi:ribonucleotide-diphosphate reductase subunit beta [Kitasatospora sp. NPDC096140]|uniref:ribonucleotide-diphosphate reductase subunit beta n=1 Tax=Kitasatospora sp. NPDC096140 TaxID=3155425 RepID=UPI00332FB84F
MTRWSPMLLDEAELRTMPDLPLPAVLGHADAVIDTRPSSRALYRSWERQHWAADEIALERDAANWSRLPDPVRQRVHKLIVNFLIGEYTGLELLGPILTGCPDEDSLVYVGTQLADESRHTHLVRRIAVDVLGMPADLEAALPEGWSQLSPAQRELSTLEAELIGRIARPMPGYEDWLRAVTVFHLVTEGILALHAQRTLVGSLRAGGTLPGIRAGFVAMTRDESRHVAFGMQALREGLSRGHEEAITDVLVTAMPLAVCVEAEEPMPAEQRAQVVAVAELLRTEAVLRMRQIGMSRAAVARVLRATDRAISLLRAPGPQATTPHPMRRTAP